MRVRLFVSDAKKPVREVKGVLAMVQQAESMLITLELPKGGYDVVQTDTTAADYVKFDTIRVSAR